MQLYSFSHSSASYRVRIALALKGIEAELIPMDLREGAHLDAKYLELNPQKRVPLLIDENFMLNQSLAIIDYLQEKFPTPSIYPDEIKQRALCRAFAHTITADIFPLQNLGVRQKLGRDFGQSENEQAVWSAHWIEAGFQSLETNLQKCPPTTQYLFADYPTLADICLVPQMNNARRYKADLSKFPTLCDFDARARIHEAFVKTAPENVK